MTINKIVTLANKSSQLMFTVMERSLRSVGCDLPLYVIPYNDQKFELSDNSFWLEDADFFKWIDAKGAHPTMRKYLSLTLEDYQYVDTDIIFLSNPAVILAPYHGFVASCTEWNKPIWTVTPGSELLLSSRCSTWQKDVFSSGQYACDKQLFTCDELRRFAELPENVEACLDFQTHEQPGINLFVLSTDINRINLTLPPVAMESTWSGDYHDFPTWNNPQTKPYLIHFAGGLLYDDHPINDLFFQFFTEAERQEWDKQVTLSKAKAASKDRWPLGVRILNQITRKIYPAFYVQPR